MTSKLTIVKAIRMVMLEAGRPLSAQEAYQQIVERNLYTFHAQAPESVVLSQIRRHCKGIDFPTASSMKHFHITLDGKYEPLPSEDLQGKTSALFQSCSQEQDKLLFTLSEIKKLQLEYHALLKEQILQDLKQLTPEAFEHFARRLLEVYGFIDVKVTQLFSDGGIDGYGKLKVGLAYMKVAFQCKRWTKSAIGRPEIDKFRGAIQGAHEQGIFFTTSKFSSGAMDVSIKSGAVPVILIDGKSIVDMMIEKSFGVQEETINVYSYALDLILGNEDSE